MTDEFNLVLELLRQIRADMVQIFDELQAQGRRLTSIERHMAGLHDEMARCRVAGGAA